MWFLKLLLLLVMIYSWPPIESGHSADYLASEDPEIEQGEEEGEEIAA